MLLPKSAPANAPFVTTANSAALSAERVLTAGTGIVIDTSTPGIVTISVGTPGTPGEWQFNDLVNSSHLLTAGF